MSILEPGIYRTYNRGNNQQTIFFNQENYFYFLRKCHKYLTPVSEILAWCLMPNHFHFLIEVTDISLIPVKVGNIEIPSITNGFRLLQSSYAKGINKQLNRTGNLFQQKTKSKLTSDKENYSAMAFHYVHQNPFAAGLVKNPEDWAYSSLPDYVGLRKGILCNRDRAFHLLDLASIDFKSKALEKIDEEIIKKIL